MNDLREIPSQCPDPEFLAAYLDGRLTPKEKTLIEKHLIDCHKCRHIVSMAIKLEKPVALTPDIDEP
jgi:predicted anti-sigma-YlaC factor YlaD